MKAASLACVTHGPSTNACAKWLVIVSRYTQYQHSCTFRNADLYRLFACCYCSPGKQAEMKSLPSFEATMQGQALLQLPWGMPSNPLGSMQQGCSAEQGRMVMPCPSISHIHDSVWHILTHNVAPASQAPSISPKLFDPQSWLFWDAAHMKGIH